VLGISYGRRILDLKDEMISFNHKSSLGKYVETLLGQPDSNYNLRVPTVSSSLRRLVIIDKISCHRIELGKHIPCRFRSARSSFYEISTPGKYIVETVGDVQSDSYHSSHLELSGPRFYGFPYV
jgi:hypothetical protein